MKKYRRLILVILMLFTLVYAKEVGATSFRAAEYVENVYRNKEKNGEVISSKKERLIRDSITGEIVYCIEPYGLLSEDVEYNTEYTSYSSDINITKEEYDRILLLVYYGYNYKTHTDPKWYSITQIMIWRTIDKTSNFYWVNEPNGQRIEPYKNEIEELENLVKDHSRVPDLELRIDKKISINKEYTFKDKNNILKYYKVTYIDDNARLKENNVIVNFTSEGEKEIRIEEVVDRYPDIAKIYLSHSSQNLIKVGNYHKKSSKLTFNVVSGNLTITKVDKDTNNTKPSGEASLIGAVYELYDENENIIDLLTIKEDSKAEKGSLSFGKYKLKEIQSGKGYYINDKIYEFEVSEQNTNIKIIVENEVISSKIILHKYYGKENDWHNEANIVFKIYDKDGNIYKEIKTSSEGISEFVLPFGKYKFAQMNTTDNYQIVNNFELIIDENTERIINCNIYDLEIDAPNTSTNEELKIIIIYFKKEEYE